MKWLVYTPAAVKFRFICLIPDCAGALPDGSNIWDHAEQHNAQWLADLESGMKEEGCRMARTNEGAVPLIVTTLHRGVFFGYGQPTEAKIIHLRDVRMCIYWPESNKGVMGLASEGPHKGARVGPKAPSIILQDVTAILGCSAQAAEAWESAPWHS